MERDIRLAVLLLEDERGLALEAAAQVACGPWLSEPRPGEPTAGLHAGEGPKRQTFRSTLLAKTRAGGSHWTKLVLSCPADASGSARGA